LEPWLDQVVIIGGWAHQLYQLHPDAQQLEYPPLTTLDTDVAVPAELPDREQDIRERLLAQGFTEELLGDSRPPATHYRLGGDASGFYAEFLTPLVGSEYDRKHRRRATLQVGGVVSQQLRYIEVLLHEPWSIDYESDGYGARVLIANPLSYMAQKILIHAKRGREDRAKDILYIHDTLEVFAPRLQELAKLWRESVAPRLTPRAVRFVTQAARVLFGELSDDVRRASEVAGARGRSPEAIREACDYGLSQLFGRY
jgi:hypothetical protein